MRKCEVRRDFPTRHPLASGRSAGRAAFKQTQPKALCKIRDRGRESRSSPSLRTVQADLPHTALRSVVLPPGGLTNRSCPKERNFQTFEETDHAVSPRGGRQHASLDRNSVFSTSPFAEATPACLAGWHSRWLVDCPVRPDSSTFLRSLRSIPVTGLRRYYGRSDSCEAGSSAPVFGQHERRFSPPQVSLIHVSDLPTLPSPTTPQALDADFARYPSSRRVSHSRGSRLHLS